MVNKVNKGQNFQNSTRQSTGEENSTGDEDVASWKSPCVWLTGPGLHAPTLPTILHDLYEYAIFFVDNTLSWMATFSTQLEELH